MCETASSTTSMLFPDHKIECRWSQQNTGLHWSCACTSYHQHTNPIDGITDKITGQCIWKTELVLQAQSSLNHVWWAVWNGLLIWVDLTSHRPHDPIQNAAEEPPVQCGVKYEMPNFLGWVEWVRVTVRFVTIPSMSKTLKADQSRSRCHLAWDGRRRSESARE